MNQCFSVVLVWSELEVIYSNKSSFLFLTLRFSL